MTKKCAYRVKLSGDEALVPVLSKFIPENQESLGVARAKRRAVEELFGDKVKVKIYSVQRPERGEVKAL